jgi:sugar phosphate isomerase/epimerase
MRLGIFAKTFPGTTPDVVIAAACAAGFSAVQYNMACSGLAPMPDAIPDAAAKAVSTAAGRAGVEIAAVSGTYNMIHPDPAVRARGLARLEILARSSASLDTALITLCTGTRDPDDQWRAHPDNDTPEAWRDLRTEITKAIAIADLYGVDLGIEPELANVINSAAKARRLIDELQSPRLKIVLDAANLFEAEPLQRQRDIVSAAIDILADRIVMGHAKDRTPSGAFTTAGQGVLDYAHYVAKLHAVGFNGSLVTHGLGASEAAPVAVFLSRVLAEQGVEIAP